jgi:glutaredoxin
VLFHARDCHLCADARAELERLGAELGFALAEVEIDGVPELERRYRERIPVVEIDGAEVATYHVFPGPFRRAFAAAQSRLSPGTS